jgi:hypothetical protein
MNFFSKNRFIFWLLIFLVVINLTGLISFLVFFSRNTTGLNQKSQESPGITFQKKLSLSPSQSEKVKIILTGYKDSTEPITTNIRNYRIQLLDELKKDIPDTTLLNVYAERICLLQKQMQKASIKQYIALKGICNPDQCQRLSALYFELYGCQGNFKGMGQGKGMMHQYGKGKGHKGRGMMMGNDSSGK